MSKQMTFIEEKELCDYCGKADMRGLVPYKIDASEGQNFEKKVCNRRECMMRAHKESMEFISNGFRMEVGV